ncbi:MAG TPA: hypothetical protein VF707_20995 [Ardenticatenaceae bacterium]
MQTRLIMVEGVPFTGKSTLSEFVAQQLRLNGTEAHWVSEGMLFQRHFPHVIASFDQQQPVSEAQLWEDWNAFVQAIMAAPAPFVVDSALSYTLVYPLLAEDRPTEEIFAFCNRVADLCAPLQPRVIHLTGDVDYLVRASIAERGKAWEEQLVRQSEAAPYQQARGRTGVEGAIGLDGDAQALTGRVLERGWQALTLNVTPADRPANQRDILDFLGIDEVPFEHPTFAQSVLQSYTGSYATDDPEAQLKLLFVRFEGEGLALHGPDSRYGALIPLSETRFHLRASPLDFEFVVEEGLACRLLLFTSDGKTRVYLRV